MKTPDELRAEAKRLRQSAEAVAHENPSASDYWTFRADWYDYLADMQERADVPQVVTRG